MTSKNFLGVILLTSCLLAVLIFAGIYVFPWKDINWGKIEFKNKDTITVVGRAEQAKQNKIASFNVGVSVIKDNKDEAIAEVNNKIAAIIKAVKDFGVLKKDIKTQSLNIYQSQETYYEDGRKKRRPGQWNVSNTINIILRNVDRASALADLISKSGATNVYGPSFRLEEKSGENNDLFQQAMKNAREKAELIAESEGRQLGKAISISEGWQSRPVYPLMKEGGGAGGAPLEPGSSAVSKTVTVVFELK